jgi:hypothetical protein
MPERLPRFRNGLFLEAKYYSAAGQHIVSPPKALRADGLYAQDPEIRLASNEVAHLGAEAEQRNSRLDVHSAAKLQRTLVLGRPGQVVMRPAAANAAQGETGNPGANFTRSDGVKNTLEIFSAFKDGVSEKSTCAEGMPAIGTSK